MKLFFYIIFLFSGASLLCGQDIKDGYTEFYYPDGKISSKGWMKNGKPDGFWVSYYPSGIIKSEGLRRNFLLDSTWTFYNQKAEVNQRIDYKYGKRNGYIITYSTENSVEPKIISRELYLNDKKEGISYYYHQDGSIKQEIPFKKGMREGQAREYDTKGKLITLIDYRNNYIISRERINRLDSKGQKQGTWKEFYKNGKLYKEISYKDNELDGYYREYNPEGALVLSLKYIKGVLIEEEEEIISQQELDIKREFNSNGKLSFQGSFKKEIPVGIHRFYNEDGEVINAKIYDDLGRLVSEGIVDEKGERKGPWKDFYFTGELRSNGAYLNNRKSGKWTFYYKNGVIEQVGNYLRGLPDGLWTWYYPGGELLREEGYFNGREDGEMVEYDIKGNIITKGNYINGEKEGEWIYNAGDHIEKGSYTVGLREGKWYFYYLDEVIHFEGNFLQGQEDGKHKYYYPDGELKEERFYRMGIKERNWKKYDENGNLTMTISYKNDVEYRINGEKINLPKGSIRIIN